MSLGDAVGVVYKIMLLKKYKHELDNTKEELNKTKFLLNMTKTDCCDLCMTEAINYSNPNIRCDADLDKEEHQPIINIQMGFRTIKLCGRHVKELSNELKIFAEENNL